MICTVTLNPAYDKTVEIQDLIPHETNKILSVRFDPGGKGINVSRVIHELGRKTKALGIIGGDTGRYIRSHLEHKGIETGFVEVNQPTRTNLTIIDIGDPPATELNEPGPTVDERIILDVEKTILDTLSESKFFVFAGSLPGGCPATTYNRLIDLVRQRGAISVLDTRDEALVEGLKAKPYLVKPNKFEASDFLGREVVTVEDAARACLDFHRSGIPVAIISMGDKGAIMACREGIWKAVPPRVEEGSAVGAGDSLVAGVCIGIDEKMPMEEAFRLGVASGTATATTPGTALCEKAAVYEILPLVRLEAIEAGDL